MSYIILSFKIFIIDSNVELSFFIIYVYVDAPDNDIYIPSLVKDINNKLLSIYSEIIH